MAEASIIPSPFANVPLKTSAPLMSNNTQAEAVSSVWIKNRPVPGFGKMLKASLFDKGDDIEE